MDRPRLVTSWQQPRSFIAPLLLPFKTPIHETFTATVRGGGSALMRLQWPDVRRCDVHTNHQG